MCLIGALAMPLDVIGGEAAPASPPKTQVARVFQNAECESAYINHLQGICTNGRDAIFWSWTDTLVKTDAHGGLLKQISVANHHGDLCFFDGKVYVAVNLGYFNLPAGCADSWVYVYAADTLAEVERRPTPEVVHGAGGIAYHAGRFIVVGGLPPGTDENYLYEYDSKFRFKQRHVLASGYTLMGIQTAEFAEGAWWFGCYGNPKSLLRASQDLQLTGHWEFDASLGISGLGGGRFLIGQNIRDQSGKHRGRTVLAHFNESKGLLLEPRK